MKRTTSQRSFRLNARWRKDTGTTYDRPPTREELEDTPYTRKVIALMSDAAQRGDTTALECLGYLYEHGARDERGRTTLKPDLRKAERCMRRAAKLGNVDALRTLGDLLSRDRSHRGVQRAAPFYRAAFRRGDVGAAYNLANSYQNVGLYRDAVRWFRRALEADDSSNSIALARAELYGLGTKRNVNSAFSRLRAIANGPTEMWPPNTDRIEAILVMAEALITGWPVRRDYDEGKLWLRRAESLGSKVAKAMLELLE